MKKLILIFCFLAFSEFGTAQNWAPIGATWHYSKGFFKSFNIKQSFFTIESKKDTIVAGLVCKKLLVNNFGKCTERSDVELMYQKNDSVYAYDTSRDVFQLIYDFGAQKGDKWSYLVDDQLDYDTVVVIVNSTGSMQINGNTLRWLKVTYLTLHNRQLPNVPPNLQTDTLSNSGKIIESIGDLAYMFNYQVPYRLQVCDGEFSEGLRCYQDSIIGFWDRHIADSCEAIYYIKSGLNDLQANSNLIHIYPNPAQSLIHLSFDIPIEVLQLQILDTEGRVVKTIGGSTNQISVESLDAGLYFIKIITSEGIAMKKLMKEGD